MVGSAAGDELGFCAEPISREFIGDSFLAQARTLALLLKLDRFRKRYPLKSIAQLNLINRDAPLLNLKNAGLDTADLHEVTLLDVSLRQIWDVPT